MKTYVNAEGWL